MNPIQQAIDAVGGRTNAASLLGISYVAVRKMAEKVYCHVLITQVKPTTHRFLLSTVTGK